MPELKGCRAALPQARLELQGSRLTFPAPLAHWGQLLLKVAREATASGCLSKLFGVTAR